MSTESAVFGFFMEYIWVPMTGSWLWLWSKLMQRNKELQEFQSETQLRLTLLESRLVTAEMMKLIVREALEPHLLVLGKLDKDVGVLRDRVTDLRIATGKREMGHDE